MLSFMFRFSNVNKLQLNRIIMIEQINKWNNIIENDVKEEVEITTETTTKINKKKIKTQYTFSD